MKTITEGREKIAIYENSFVFEEDELRELTEEEQEEMDGFAQAVAEEIETRGGIEALADFDGMLETVVEGFFGKAFGTVAGWIAGPAIGRVIAKALGVEKGILYDFLTSRLAGAAIGRAVAGHFEKKKIAKVKVK